MNAHDHTASPTELRFATELRAQFEGLGETTASASGRRGRTLLAAGIAAACLIAVVATAVALLRAPAGGPGSGPRPQLAMVSPTAAPRYAPTPEPYLMRLPGEVPEVTTIGELTVDGTGRPWLAGGLAARDTPFVAYLEGDQWVRLPTPDNETTLGPIAVVSTEDLWSPVAHGYVHWDGTAWSKVSAPVLDGDIAGISDMAVLSTTDIWAVGRQKGDLYKISGDGPGEHTLGNRPLTMHFDGTAWSEIKAPVTWGRTSTLEAVSSAGGETWAVGRYEEKTGEVAPTNDSPLGDDIVRYGPIALRWQGSHWAETALPGIGKRGTALDDVLVLARDDVWVLGRTYQGDESRYRDETVSTYLAHWNGSVWEQLKLPRHNELDHFWSLAGTGDGDIWLAGDDRNGVGWGETAHWDGAQWTVATPTAIDENNGGTEGSNGAGEATTASGSVGSGMPQITANSPTDIWFNPGFTRFWRDGSSPADPMLYHWDGQSWSKVVVPF